MSGPSTSEVAEGSQEDAAAAWRAQRAQKSCLHSDKPGDSKDAAAKWHPMEAIWRVGTLPLKIAHNSIAVSFRERTRQSWSASLEQAVRNLRTYSQNSTLSLTMVRSIHDNVVGSSSVPVDATRTQCDLGSGLKAWWFMPDTLQHQAEASRFIFYVHGPTSSPGSSSHRALVSRLALEAGAAVLMVDYRRTPEKTREESQDDVSKAYRWLVVQPGVTPASTLVMADGLGCALALNLCADLRDETAAGSDDVQPAGIGLLSPWVDLSDSGTFKSKSWEKNQQVDYLSQRILSFTASGYAGLSPLDDMEVSPISRSFAKFPPVYVSVGQCEVLLDQGLQLADKMRKDGVLVDVDEAEDMVHAFQLLAPFHSACTAGILRLATFARRMAPGNMKLPVQQVDALMGGLEVASPSSVFTPAADDQ